jgi:N-acetylglutamate synthase-like GNAT family acetyltransferase
MSSSLIVHGARASDVTAIVGLIDGYAGVGVMLPRSAESVLLTLADFVVAEIAGRAVGCGALKEYSPSLAEVASLAVAADAHGQGVGRAIVSRLEGLAATRGIGELFALTLTPTFFESIGYAVAERSRYPEKVRRDCVSCARRARCVEVCVSRILAPRVLATAA